MKIKQQYKVREMAGEHVVIIEGRLGVDMTRIISLNASAHMMWEALVDKSFTLDDAARLLVETYGIDDAQAQKDASVWVEALKKCGVIEE